jgi:hypothetical protein
VLVAAAATGCGDDEASEPVMMGPSVCTTGTVRTCVGMNNCPGRHVCNSGSYGTCICDQPPLNDGSVNEPDGSMASDASTTEDAAMNEPDGSMMSDAAMNEADSGPDAAPNDECNGGCIPEAPADFEGPFLTFIGGDDPPGCGGAYGDEGPTGSTGLVAPAANCSSCTCDSTSNSCATFVNLEANGNAMCGGAGVCSNTFNQACAELTVGCLDAAATMTRVQASVPANAGACSPSEQDPDIDPPTFAQFAYSCAPDDALAPNGCGSDQLCAPDGPFNGSYCVTREGAHDCPSGSYSERRVFFGGVEDTRDCSACACDRDCDYTVELFPDADTTCGGAASATLSIASPNEAEEASNCAVAPVGTGGTLRAAFSVTGGGTCSASGGEPVGSATGADPITFCCLD